MWQCPHCFKTFPKKVGLSLHLHHKQASCGRKFNEQYDTVKFSSYPTELVERESIRNEMDVDDEESVMEMEFGEMSLDDKDNEVVLLTKDDLMQLPGEMQAVSHRIEQRIHTELIQLLDAANAPDHLFKDILEWACKAKQVDYNFHPNQSSRAAVVEDLKRHFNMEHLVPKISMVELESVEKPMPVVSFNFRAQLLSMLMDPSIMSPENLVINESTQFDDGSTDYSPWFKPYNAPNGVVDEVMTGKWYRYTVEEQLKSPNDFICPVILYIDRTFIEPNEITF